MLSKDRRWQIAERVRHGEADAIEQAIHDNRSDNSKKYLGTAIDDCACSTPPTIVQAQCNNKWTQS